jgi:hypothetical protein
VATVTYPIALSRDWLALLDQSDRDDAREQEQARADRLDDFTPAGLTHRPSLPAPLVRAHTDQPGARLPEQSARPEPSHDEAARGAENARAA